MDLDNESDMYTLSDDRMERASIITAFSDTSTLVNYNRDSDTASIKKQLKDEFASKLDNSNMLRIKVVGIGIRSIEKKNSASLILSVKNMTKEQWRIEKTPNDIIRLHANLSKRGFSYPLPSKSVLSSNSPANSNKRVALVEVYLQQALEFAYTTSNSATQACTFLSTDVVPQRIENKTINATKEGVLLKKNGSQLFGKWVPYYFVVTSTHLQYYDNVHKRGNVRDSIPLLRAKVGRQYFNEREIDPTTDYRHGIVIDAFQRKGITDQYVRHAFCSFSEAEQNEWIKAIEAAASQKQPLLLSKLAGNK